MTDLGFEPRLEPPEPVRWDEPEYGWQNPWAVYDPEPEVDYGDV